MVALAQTSTGCAVAPGSDPGAPDDSLVTAAASVFEEWPCQQVHQASPDITVLRVEDLGRAAPGTNTVPATFNVDCSQCTVQSSEASGSYDCQFYDECLDLELDCTDELEQLTGLPMVTSATFDVWYTRVAYEENAPTEHAGETVERYYSEDFNCRVLDIVTASRTDALPYASGIGFYFAGEVTYFPMSDLASAGEVTLANGESGTLHDFGALTICWRGSMSSSSSARYEFKPFMMFEADGACYFNWDAVPENYLVSSGVSAFDRSVDVLR